MGVVIDPLTRKPVSSDVLRRELNLAERKADESTTEYDEIAWLTRAGNLRQYLAWIADPSKGVKEFGK